MVVLLRSSLNIDIFKISLSISISISIFLKYFLSISISISIFSKTTISISISISIFLELPYRYRSELPYRYRYRYRYFSKVSIYRQSICHIDISNRAIGGFSVMSVTKLLISPVKKRIFCPKTTKFGPKLAFLVYLGQAMQAYSVPCWWVGWWLWRAGCISEDTYLLYWVIPVNFGFTRCDDFQN